MCDRKKTNLKNLKVSKKDQPTTYRYTKHVRTHSLEMVRYISVPRTQTGGFWCVLFLLVIVVVVCRNSDLGDVLCDRQRKDECESDDCNTIIKVSASIRTIERL